MKNNLKQIRISKGIKTQTQLAKMMSLNGVPFTRQAVSLIETGINKRINRASADCISRILGESISEIFLGMGVSEKTVEWVFVKNYCKECGGEIKKAYHKKGCSTLSQYIECGWCSEKCFYSYVSNNPTSRGTFAAMKLKYLKDRCEVCGGTSKLLTHHLDFNWRNNNPNNFQTLCYSCHFKIHARTEESRIIRRSRRKSKIDKAFMPFLKNNTEDRCFVCGETSMMCNLCQKHYQRARIHAGNPFVYLKQKGVKWIYVYDNPITGKTAIPIGESYSLSGEEFARRYFQLS